MAPAENSGWLEGGWRSQHQECCRIGRPEQFDLVLLGDSLIQGWGGPDRKVLAAGAASWNAAFGPRRTGNLGIAGDRVRHVIWRIEHGTLAKLDPTEVLLLIGTNDLEEGASPEELTEAIVALGNLVLQLLPDAKLLLHALLPRGASADDPLRRAVRQTNALLAARVCELGPRVHFLDFTSVFQDEGGELRAELFEPDALHLNADGYAAWASALTAAFAPPLPPFADGEPRALEPAWIAAEKSVGLIACSVVALGTAIAIGVCTVLELLAAPLNWILALAWVVLMPPLLWVVSRWPHWEYPRTGYRVLPDRIEAWRGLIWRRTWSIPCARVQFTDVSQGPIQRKHGIATLQVHTAGNASSEVSVPGLPLALALEIRDWLVDRTSDDAV